jgi:hypothetical protein
MKPTVLEIRRVQAQEAQAQALQELIEKINALTVQVQTLIDQKTSPAETPAPTAKKK